MAELIALPVTLAAQRLILSLKDLQSRKKHNPKIIEEIDQFIASLHDNIDLLKKHLPKRSGSWAFESLEIDLNEAANYLEDGLKNGNLQKFWDTRETKDKLDRLRQDLTKKFQMKLFISNLEEVIDVNDKVDNFKPRMLELSMLPPAQSLGEVRKLLQPLVVGMRNDQKIQSFVSMVQANEERVETSSDTEIFVANVLATLRDLENEGPSARPGPIAYDRDEYLDPITKQLMIDPVQCTDGWTYDRFSVLQYNLEHKREPLAIAKDNLDARKELFEKFRDEGVEANFHNLRKSYKDEALKLAQKGSTRRKALRMLKHVLQWAPDDIWCLEMKDQLEHKSLSKRTSSLSCTYSSSNARGANPFQM